MAKTNKSVSTNNNAVNAKTVNKKAKNVANIKATKSAKNANANANNNNVASNVNSTTNFNKLVSKMTKNVAFENKKAKNRTATALYKSNANYQASFSNILAFEKSHHKEKSDIDVIVYHGSNNDGLLSAYIAWRFLVKDNQKKDVLMYGFRPGFSANKVDQTVERNLDRFRGKNIIILDLSYSPATLTAIKNVAKLLLVIDDHKDITQPTENVFVGDNKHAACAYTWKFFYPEINVPKIVQYIDDSDRKLGLAYLPYSALFALSFGIRYGHAIMQTSTNNLFEKLHTLFEDDNPNFWILVGRYFHEFRESIKEQASINAREITFQGIPNCYVLNLNLPSFNKPIARQIITNAKKKGLPVSIVILWGYEYSLRPPGYSITLVEEHTSGKPKYDLPQMAKKLAAIGGHPKGGFGSRFEGHFYWSKNIWDLFEKKLI